MVHRPGLEKSRFLSVVVLMYRQALTDLIVTFRGFWRSRPTELGRILRNFRLSLVLRHYLPETPPF